MAEESGHPCSSSTVRALSRSCAAPDDSTRQTVDDARNQTKVFSREWYEYAKASGKVKGRAQMSISLSQFLVDSDSYDLDTDTLSFEAESTAKKDAGRIGIGAGAGAIIGAIAGGGKGAAIGGAIGAGAGTGVTLATSGKEVEFPVEQLFEFRLANSVEMEILR